MSKNAAKATGAALVLVGALLLWWFAVGRPAEDGDGRHLAAIAARSDAASHDGEAPKLDELLVDLTATYRRSNVPVRALVDSGPGIVLLCAGSMPRWNMAEVAQGVHEQIHSITGDCARVRIYATFIGSPRVLMGELTHDEHNPTVRVTFAATQSRSLVDR